MSRRMGSSRATLLLPCLVGLLAGCGDSLVGGACAVGYLEQDGACVAVPGPGTDGWYGAGGAGEGGSGAHGGGARHPGSGGTGDGGSGASAGGETGGSGSGGSGAGSAQGGAGGGTQCDPPLVACNDGCVDTDSDPANCGGCGIVCATDLCVAGKCDGATAGHLVVIGMDYKAVALDSPAAVLLGNGVFLAAHEPVRILDYRQWSSGTSPNKVVSIVDDEAQARGRTVTWTQETNADGVPAALGGGDVDVLLVQHQSGAPAGALGVIGSAWAPAIAAFGAKGGVVVTLAVAASENEMPALLTASGILQTAALDNVSGQTMYNQGFLDALGQNVLSPFLGKSATASIDTSEVPGPDLSMVIVTGSGAPVAVHKVIPPN